MPAKTATMDLSIDALTALPVGASYEVQDGRASAKVTRTPDAGINITASCDSLLLLIEEYKEEVYHLQKVNTALKTELNSVETIEDNKLSGFVWFQIWIGRIAILLLVIYVIIKLVTNKIIR